MLRRVHRHYLSHGLIAVLLLATIAFGAQVAMTSFNCGEVSPYMLRRWDFQKYDNAAVELENMLILTEGPVTRRPGTKYIAETKTSSSISRLIPFEYSKTDTYIIEMGDEYMRFYRNGGQILDVNDDVYEITTPFENTEIFDVQYVQEADTMYLVDGNDPPQKLTRTDHDAWTIEDVNFTTGPFLDENITTTTVEPNNTTGTISLVADANIFDETHVGALWRIGYRRSDNPLVGTLDANESSSTIEVGGDYYYNIQGTWTGDAILEKSYDAGSNWETVYPRYNADSAVNEDRDDSEPDDDVLYRVTMENYEKGDAEYYLRVSQNVNYGVVKIVAYVDANEVQATVVSTLEDCNDTTDIWAEGYWSDYRGWPQTLEFYEQRLMFGGSTSYPQTIWASRTASGASDDYENMTSGVDDDDALIYVLPGQNPIQWMLAQTHLLLGTLGGVGRWGSSDDETPITPTEPTNYRMQARYGAAYMQAVMVGDAVLYVERGGMRVREFVYSLERDRFVAPDMTILAEHISGDGIVDIAYQSRPGSILWCVTDDGDLATLTYQRDQDVVGWARQTTEGSFESVAVIPGDDEDEVWVIVNRTIDDSTVRYVEQFQPRDWGSSQNDCFFVDCGLSFDGGDAVSITAATQACPTDGDGTDLADDDQIKITSVVGMTELNNNIYTIDDADSTAKTLTLADSTGTTDINSVGFTAYTSGGSLQRFERDFTNMTHLEGEGVASLSQGETQPSEDVSSGAVSVDQWGNKVHIGLPFTSQFKTMPIIIEGREGISAGKTARINEVTIDFYESLGVQYGTDADNIDTVVFYDPDVDVGDPIPLFTGVRQMPFLYGMYRNAQVYLESDQPLPFTVRMVAPKITVTEK